MAVVDSPVRFLLLIRFVSFILFGCSFFFFFAMTMMKDGWMIVDGPLPSPRATDLLASIVSFNGALASTPLGFFVPFALPDPQYFFLCLWLE
ncbi:hypothetical protein BP00DRAFT_206574 [Aspergillus indologenus CBS 114.80]|uniref:Uncharacterized protein n=1 Tax=Aspergillus indologenus CBS 114.80 TaxID=1450541 RepID=A0A2V5I2T5_9EURO|nr:hypothetical protein BP00DRAFT_206574 [Aspergillus indologenus CBS 114.80]